MGSDTTSDLSGLVIDTAVLGTGDGFVVDGSAATAAVTLTGSSIDDTLTGSNYADTISGGAGADTISAGTGNDTVSGGAGADIITGGTGDDSITAGEGADHITGGAGADTIVLTETTSAADNVVFAAKTDGSAVGVAAGTFTGYDVITGFTSGTDNIVGDSAYANNGSVVTPVFGAEQVVAATAAINALNDMTTSNFTSVDQAVNYFNDVIGSGALYPSGLARYFLIME